MNINISWGSELWVQSTDLFERQASENKQTNEPRVTMNNQRLTSDEHQRIKFILFFENHMKSETKKRGGPLLSIFKVLVTWKKNKGGPLLLFFKIWVIGEKK